MAVLLEQNLDIATLLKIAREASELTFPVHPKVVLEPVRIGIARDEAFCFIIRIPWTICRNWAQNYSSLAYCMIDTCLK